MAIDSWDIPRNPHRGSPRWFFVELGLNNYGYIPGAPRRQRDALPDNVCNEAKCKDRWGQKSGGRFWYARANFGESPRMQYRVESLYQLTHQRPIGKQRAIGLAFARGLLAEKMGFAVDWASFAAKQCTRGGKAFLTIEELKRKTELENGEWPANEVLQLDEKDLQGAPDDWELNRQPRKMNMRLVKGYDLKDVLPKKPDLTVAPPLYSRLQTLQLCNAVTSNSDSDSESDGSDNSGKDERATDDLGNATPEQMHPVGVGNGTSGKRTLNPGNKWDACPMSPGPGFEEGSRQVLCSSSDDDYEPFNASNCPPNDAPSLRILRGSGYVPADGSEHVPADDDIDLIDAQDIIYMKLDRMAVEDGYSALSTVEQLEYLRDREIEFTKLTKKRRVEEEAQADWIEKKRRKMEQEGLCRGGTSTDNVTQDAPTLADGDLSPLRFKQSRPVLPADTGVPGPTSADAQPQPPEGWSLDRLLLDLTDSD
ncbi:hypothetical protein KC19_8G026200 [Ceratodon purpureus]|uniref:Uncharacterized protein n=1 Tax=Ceratodon purpureus TaxID=3225 RepID=A0A8T0GYT0_CERPU|nr:hypothetical protein KC19_8G026200 [Ceratodon purpureus]